MSATDDPSKLPLPPGWYFVSECFFSSAISIHIKNKIKNKTVCKNIYKNKHISQGDE